MKKGKAIPSAHLLHSLASQNLSIRDALAELIDNALDAGATTVAIEFGKDYLSIQDNGHGAKSHEPFVKLGESRRHAGTELGRYGIGAKDAAVSIGGINSRLIVESVHRSQKWTLNIHWLTMSKNDWDYDLPQVEPAQAGEIGTRIHIRPVQRRIPDGKNWERLTSEIGYLYSPAIKQGKQITMRAKKRGSLPVPVRRWELPKFDAEVIDTEINVNGKGARVYCGLVAEGEPNPRLGLTYSHGFRVIVPASQRGCGRHNASRVCGFVQLDGSWHLAKNKDSIIGDDAEDLYRAVEDACLPVLKRADEAGATLASRAFENEVGSTLNAALDMAKAKRRSKRNSTGGKSPTGKGGRHKKADREQDGETFPRKVPSGRVTICHTQMGEGRVGKFDAPVVYLNRDHAWVEDAYLTNNKLAGVILATALISADIAYGPKGSQLKLRGIDESSNQADVFARAMGTILSADTSVDGKPALKAVK